MMPGCGMVKQERLFNPRLIVDLFFGERSSALSLVVRVLQYIDSVFLKWNLRVCAAQTGEEADCDYRQCVCRPCPSRSDLLIWLDVQHTHEHTEVNKSDLLIVNDSVQDTPSVTQTEDFYRAIKPHL